MPIFLTLQNSGTSNPTFKERGIPDRMPGQVGEIPVYAYPGSKKVSYDLMLAVLPGILNAQVTGTGTFSPRDNLGIFSKVNRIPGIRFSPPIGYFTFQGLSESQKADLSGSGLTVEPSKPSTYIGCPDFDKMASVYGLEPSSDRIPPDYASADAIFAYTLFLKGMAFFAAASHTLAHSEMGLLVSTNNPSVSDKGDAVVEFGATKDTTKFSLDAPGWTILSKTTAVPITTPIDNTRGFTRGIITSTSPKIRRVNDGGRFFPYFHNMCLPDRTLAYEVFADIFFNCLLDDPAQVPAVMNRLRKGAGNLAKTEAGMAISHAYMGIRLAKQGHASIIFVISKGIYQGFVLEGDFVVALGAASWKPKAFTEVESDVEASNKHDATLRKIAVMFEMAKSTAGTTLLPTRPEDINTSRKFLRHFKLIQLNAYETFPDWMKDLRQAVSELSYNEVFEPLSLNTLKIFLRYVVTEDESLLDNLPAWLNGYFEKCGSPVATGLGIFGNVALSVNYGGDKDQKFTIPLELGAVDPNMQMKSDGTRVLPYLPVKKVEINRALGHWNRLFESGVFQIKPGRKGKKEFTDHREVLFEIGGVPSFPEVYGMIKERVVASKVAGRGKRRAEASGSASGSSNKRRNGGGKASLGAL